MKTFIIDDDNISMYLAKHILKATGYPEEVCCFLSAENALQELLQDIPTNVPQIIFLDLNMPGMNGWKFLEALTPYKQQLLGRCQIYILTSSVDLSDITKAEEFELVRKFLNKPIGSAEIKAIMSEVENEPAKYTNASELVKVR